MNNCPKCGSEIEESQRFCTKCGFNISQNTTTKYNKLLIIALSICCILILGISLYTISFFANKSDGKTDYLKSIGLINSAFTLAYSLSEKGFKDMDDVLQNGVLRSISIKEKQGNRVVTAGDNIILTFNKIRDNCGYVPKNNQNTNNACVEVTITLPKRMFLGFIPIANEPYPYPIYLYWNKALPDKAVYQYPGNNRGLEHLMGL